MDIEGVIRRRRDLLWRRTLKLSAQLAAATEARKASRQRMEPSGREVRLEQRLRSAQASYEAFCRINP